MKIHFDEGSTYNEFIEVLNIFNEREAELYILDHNTMYFVGRDWDPNAKDSEIDFEDLVFLDCSGWSNDVEDNNNLKSFINNLKTQFNQNKIIYSAYGALFLAGIFYIYRKNKKLPK